MFESLNQKNQSRERRESKGEGRGESEGKGKWAANKEQAFKGRGYKKKGVQFVPIPGHMEDPR